MEVESRESREFIISDVVVEIASKSNYVLTLIINRRFLCCLHCAHSRPLVIVSSNVVVYHLIRPVLALRKFSLRTLTHSFSAQNYQFHFVRYGCFKHTVRYLTQQRVI